MDDERLVQHELGFWRIKDLPSDSELEEYYSMAYYQGQRANYRHHYPDIEIEVQASRLNRQIGKALGFRNQMTAEESDGKFLDVGCGEGFALAAMKTRGWAVKGIDFSLAGVSSMNPEMVSFVKVGDTFPVLDALIQDNETFDLVWLSHVLEHVTDPVDLMSKLRKLMAPGAVLVVSIPNDGNEFHERLLKDGLIKDRWWISPPDHLSYFTRESLEGFVKACGFHVRSIEASFPVDWFLAHHGSNYVTHPEKGPEAHSARLTIESIIERTSPSAASGLYEALADVGMGRDLAAFLQVTDG